MTFMWEDYESFYLFELMDGTTREGQVNKAETVFFTSGEPMVIGIKSYPAGREVSIPWRAIASYKKVQRRGFSDH